MWLRRLWRLWKHDKATWMLHHASNHLLNRFYTTIDVCDIKGDLLAVETLQRLTEEMLRNRSQI